MKQYETFELHFSGETLQEAWAGIDLTAVFTHDGESKTVKGFYDGEGQYVIRFLPEEPGDYSWKVSGVIRAEGKEICGPAEGRHGPVRAADTHFEYADGSLFIPFGTTVYALASQEDELVEETLETLKSAPFNKVRMCVFPKHYDYNHNEPPFFAFEKRAEGGWDTGRPCIPFWHRLEKILNRIQAMNIQIDLILFHPYDRWGFASLPQQANLEYLDYLLRRLAAMPNIWWSLANEYDLCMPAKSLKDWEEIEEFVAANDPYRHLLSSHNCFCHWDFSRENVTHCSIQTKALTEIPRWMETYHKPVVIDECAYEGNLPHPWGSISGKEMVYRFWRCYASGASCTHGETFLSNDEILWWARGGQLKGESPKRIAFLREIMESLPGPLTPWLTEWSRLPLLSAQSIRAMLAARPAPEGFTLLALNSLARMSEAERATHMQADHSWASRCGDQAFLKFFDLQTCAEFPFELPEEKQYRVELIDVWEMTRKTILENAGGKTLVKLPAKEGMAVLIARM
ncbi:MAG: DUF5060 domain-containing protein [Clostridia bacterium]|nr:DUF5060 domain-containing protein [Clostridia bacterium]